MGKRASSLTLLGRSRAYFFAMRPKAGEMVLRRQCERTSCLRHFAQIEEVHSSSLMRVQVCGVWQRAVMRETAEMAGPAAEKKKAVGNANHAILTTNYRCVDLTMHMHKQSLRSIVSHPRTANSCRRNDEVSIFFDGKSIISSFVSQAILSIFSGHVL